MQREHTAARDDGGHRNEDMDTRETADRVAARREPGDIGDDYALPRRRRWPWVLLGLVVFTAVALGLVTRSSAPSADEELAAVVNQAEVVATDLVEVESLAGTLGRVADDPITNLKPGVLTFAAEAGAVVANGEVLYRVEGDPVVLLAGQAPPWRDIGLTSGATPVVAGTNGIITAMPEVGEVIEQGDILFEVDGQPVVALYGETPAFRALEDLSDHIAGPDVAQFETALAALGFSGFTVDDEFTNATENAAEDWQESVGAADDGVVDLGEVVFIPGPSVVTSTTAVGSQVGGSQSVVMLATEPLTSGPDVAQLEAALVALGYGEGLVVDLEFTVETRSAVLEWQADVGADTDGIVNLGEVFFAVNDLRIAEQLVPIGSTVNNGTPILGITAAEIVVRVDLPADSQDLVTDGDSVTVILPDDTEVAATVASVATVASFDQQGNAVFEVLITLGDPGAAAGLDEAPVDVDVISDSATNVIAVPVSALLALSESGYAVEVLQGDGSTVLVSVEPGFYADGMVEVIETNLQPGMMVVVP